MECSHNVPLIEDQREQRVLQGGTEKGRAGAWIQKSLCSSEPGSLSTQWTRTGSEGRGTVGAGQDVTLRSAIPGKTKRFRGSTTFQAQRLEKREQSLTRLLSLMLFLAGLTVTF